MYNLIRTGLLCFVSMFLVIPTSYAVSTENQFSKNNQNNKRQSPPSSTTRDGQSESLYTLGLKYLEGNGVVTDTGKAYRLFKQAAMRGYPRAEYQLGLLYRDGKGVARDKKEALKWFRLAAAWGDEEAQHALSMLVEELSDNAIDNNHSNILAVRKGPEGQYKLAITYLEDSTARQNIKYAFLLLQKSAKSGFRKSQYQLGLLYRDGIGTSKDTAKAKKWFAKAASDGSLNAHVALSELLRQEKNEQADTTEIQNRYKFSSGSSYQRAAQKGDINAQYNLGIMYIEGDILEKNPALALYWLRSAARSSHLGAQVKLGGLFYTGIELDRNYAESAMWYHRAAEQGHASAQYLLGNMYRKGVGLDKNKSKAQQWYRKAAQQGHIKAKDKLAIAN